MGLRWLEPGLKRLSASLHLKGDGEGWITKVPRRVRNLNAAPQRHSAAEGAGDAACFRDGGSGGEKAESNAEKRRNGVHHGDSQRIFDDVPCCGDKSQRGHMSRGETVNISAEGYRGWTRQEEIYGGERRCGISDTGGSRLALWRPLGGIFTQLGELSGIKHCTRRQIYGIAHLMAKNSPDIRVMGHHALT